MSFRCISILDTYCLRFTCHNVFIVTVICLKVLHHARLKINDNNDYYLIYKECFSGVVIENKEENYLEIYI